MENDELKIYRGEDFVISEHISIHQPSLNEICNYGEQDYYSMVCMLTSTPQSMKWQLWDMGIDYTTITPYQLFCNLLIKIYPKEKTSILFGDLDFTKFNLIQNHADNSVILSQLIETKLDNDISNVKTSIQNRKATIWKRFKEKVKTIFHPEIEPKISATVHNEIEIDESVYNMIMDYLRTVHNIPKDEKIPANETTKMILIEDAREDFIRNQNKAYHSQLLNLISSMVNCEGFKYNHSQVWDMKINAFMDSVKRISKIKNTELLLQSGYSGFGINLKDIDKKQLDWLGELE